ncbi:hypothetical protein BGW38_003756, partial [Lunasporangiospora selenospora]
MLYLQIRLDDFHKAAQENSASKEHGDLVLILDVRTRWKSTHRMIKRALLLRSAYNEICENNADMEGYAISESGYLQHLAALLERFDTLTAQISASISYSTIPFTIFVNNKLIDHLEDFLDKHENLGTLPDNAMHPNMRFAYWEDQDWEDSYQEATQQMVRTEWSANYADASTPTAISAQPGLQAMGTNQQHRAWAKKKIPGQEHVLLPHFARRFQFSDKDTASSAFEALISSPELRKSRREKIRKAFIEFRKNSEVEFWSQRAVEVNTRDTTNQTTVAVQRAGAKKAQNEYECQDLDLEIELLDDTSDDDSDAGTESSRKGSISEQKKPYEDATTLNDPIDGAVPDFAVGVPTATSTSSRIRGTNVNKLLTVTVLPTTTSSTASMAITLSTTAVTPLVTGHVLTGRSW